MKLAATLALALGAALVLPAAGPALAAPAPATAEEQSLMETAAPALTPTLAIDRQASAAYLDDAERLLTLGRQRLAREGSSPQATRDLMAASGKLTTSYLIMFLDPAFAARIEPLAESCRTALDAAAAGDAEAARVAVDRLVPQVARAADTQFAQIGGGAGLRRQRARD